MKKLLSIVLSIAMLSAVIVPMSVSAGDADSFTTVTVKYSVFDEGRFKLEPTDLQVSSNLSDDYADVIGYNDTIDEPSVLDATIAAHLLVCGNDFAKNGDLALSEQGWVNGAFGKQTNAVGYRNNGVSCMSFDEALTDGGYVEFMFYGDTEYWSDAYYFFENRSETVLKGDTHTFNLSQDYWGSVSPASYAIIYIDDVPYDYTDEDGNVTLQFDELGVHTVTAYPDYESDEYYFSPYCEVYVVDDYARAQIEGAGDYLSPVTARYDVNSAADFLTYLKAGAVTDTQKKYFVKSVEENWAANGGTIVTAKGQSFATYGAIIQAYQLLGKDVTELVVAMEQTDVNADCNPYYYRLAIDVASESFAKALCDAFITKYYTLGKGMDYWGVSCDNLCYFIRTIAPYASDYSEYVIDALALLEGYKTTGGYFYSSAYGTDANCDSTALALMAYSAVGDMAKCNDAYKSLVEGYELGTGVFGFAMGDKANNIATKDALIALEDYEAFVKANGVKHTSHIDKIIETKDSTCTAEGHNEYRCVLCGTQWTETINAKGHKIVKDKAVAATYEKAGKTEGKHCSVCGKVIVAQKTVAKLKVAAPTSVKITAKSKGFKLSWSKNSKATGYQVQYSTKSDFSANKKSYKLKNSTLYKSFTGLKAGKKYYARVRCYKTVNGKTYYSTWVKKSVTTKK